MSEQLLVWLTKQNSSREMYSCKWVESACGLSVLYVSSYRWVDFSRAVLLKQNKKSYHVDTNPCSKHAGLWEPSSLSDTTDRMLVMVYPLLISQQHAVFLCLWLISSVTNVRISTQITQFADASLSVVVNENTWSPITHNWMPMCHKHGITESPLLLNRVTSLVTETNWSDKLLLHVTSL